MVYEKNVDERIAEYPIQDPYFNLFGKVDEGAAREREYNKALEKYPTPKTCVDLKAALNSLNNEIKTQEEKKVSTISTGGSGRVEARAIDGYSRRRDELVRVFNEWYCDTFEKQQAHQQYLNDFNTQLENVKKITSTEDKTTTYVVFGMLGIVVVGAAFIILR